MPKKVIRSARGGRGGRNDSEDRQPYYGHDDRLPKVWNGNPRLFKGKRLARNMTLACLNEDDVQMATSSNNNNRQVVIRGRDRHMVRGRSSPLPQNRRYRDVGFERLQLILHGEPTYKIIIPYGHKYDKNYVVTNLLSYISPQTFVPIMYKVTGNEASFYIDDSKAASALYNADRKITTTDGFKLQVRVTKPAFPQCLIDEPLKTRLTQVMAKRYVQQKNALDLSKFHRDPDLVNDYFCALYRPAMLRAVLDLVSEHIPHLEALNLDGNKLNSLDKLDILDKKFSNLKILYLGDNRVKDINQIDSFKNLKLQELKLAGNPLCNKYKTRQNDYISDVRKRFPKLLRLDNMELPKPILFDVVDEGNRLPPPLRMFVANTKAQDIASQFLQQYFLIFDSENRQPLLDAYVEHASFSLTVSYLHSPNKMSGYLLENRNLLRVNETHKRYRLLKQGRLPVVSFISEMPPTTHYLDSFTMDICLTDGMMLITVTGLFKQLDKKEQPVRYFNRTFIIVPEGSGYCIRNEQLHISAPTDAQLKQLNSQPAPQITSPSSHNQTASSSGISKPVSAQLPENVKQQMTMTLSQQTNMNLEWSLKCLEEVSWNYDNALAAFQEFYKQGRIPSEAFNK